MGIWEYQRYLFVCTREYSTKLVQLKNQKKDWMQKLSVETNRTAHAVSFEIGRKVFKCEHVCFFRFIPFARPSLSPFSFRMHRKSSTKCENNKRSDILCVHSYTYVSILYVPKSWYNRRFSLPLVYAVTYTQNADGYVWPLRCCFCFYSIHFFILIFLFFVFRFFAHSSAFLLVENRKTLHLAINKGDRFI